MLGVYSDTMYNLSKQAMEDVQVKCLANRTTKSWQPVIVHARYASSLSVPLSLWRKAMCLRLCGTGGRM